MAQRFYPFKLFPVTLAACALFILFKVDEIATGQKYLARGVLPPAYASEKAEEPAAAGHEEAKKEESGDHAAAGEEKSAEGGEHGGSGEGEKAAEGEEVNKNVSLTPPEEVIDVDRRYNQIELDLLQNLSQRREEIDKYADDVNMREKLLEATELRIDNKIKQMQLMQKDLKEQLERSKAKEDTEMKSLVKIYENMKPADAARIFNELDMNILLDVVDRMSEKKAAPILANMSAVKAKDVTVKLAEMRQIRQQATKDIADGALAGN